MDLIERISHLALGACQSQGADLVDVEVFRAGKRRVVRVYVGKSPSVSIEDCTQVSRRLSILLDAENVLEDERYTLEVSSPGIDRPFKSIRDWQRNVGRVVRITTQQPVQGKNIVTGKLLSADDKQAVIETQAGPLEVKYTQVSQARCEIVLPS
jgi:ribosome maturation factor RimP